MTTTERPAPLDAAVMGTAQRRVEGRAKVTGTAPYALEHPVTAPLFAFAVQATIARGRVRRVDTTAAAAAPGVVRVLTFADAPPLADTSDGELAILQDDAVHFRGQLLGVVVAETLEAARAAAALVELEYDAQTPDVDLRTDRADLYAPETVNAGFPTDDEQGDVDAGLAVATAVVDRTYRTQQQVNSPMEPHATTATWTEDDAGPRLTLLDSTQGVHAVRTMLAPVLGLDPERLTVVAPHVGGGFGSKGSPHANVVLAALAARAVPGRPVRLAMTRQQTFALVGYRTPTIQHVRLAADAGGRFTAITHDVVEQTATVKEFAEQTAQSTRLMYASPARRTTHRLAALDVPVPFWMRAPGEMPGMHAVELAVDELAAELGIDPIELRVRNEPDVDPSTGKPWSQRRVVDCLREGARRFGWDERDPAPGVRWDGRWRVGTGVAAATYPHNVMPGSQAEVSREADGRYRVRIGAVDIGTGARTTLAMIAADALGVGVDDVVVELGSTDQPHASVAGGSAGTTSWGSTVVAAARVLRAEHGADPATGASATADMPSPPDSQEHSISSFGAQFAQVAVHADTGELRVDRMLGVFSIGRVINPRTLRSQLLGGMIMGLSGAILEDAVRDPRTGHVITQDFADYHLAANADVRDVEAVWLDEVDPQADAMGSRGAGEIGIVGAAAAIANAVHHATGVRVRQLPVTGDQLLGR